MGTFAPKMKSLA